MSKYGEDGAREKLKEFATRVMDEYARNFKRPGIDSHKDLLWFGKLEITAITAQRQGGEKRAKEKRVAQGGAAEARPDNREPQGHHQ